jgi:hypothetical protein
VLGTDGTARHDLCLASDRCYKEEALASSAAVVIFTTLDDVRATVCRDGSVQPHLQAVIVIARKGAEKCNQTQRKAMQCRHVLAVHRWRKRCYEFSCHGGGPWFGQGIRLQKGARTNLMAKYLSSPRRIQ